MAINIKDQELTDSKVPGSTDFSVKIKSTGTAAKVTIVLKSEVSTIKFSSNNSDEIELSNNHQAGTSWTNFSKDAINIKGNASTGLAKFNVKVTNNANSSDNEDKDFFMTVKP